MLLRSWFVFLSCLTPQLSIQLLACNARADTLEGTTGAQSVSNDGMLLRSQELMKQGAAKFAHGDWQGAYESYRRAWDLKPHPAIAANMAATEIKLGQYLQAANHLKYALDHLPLVQIEKRGAVEEQLEQLREKLVAVSLSANLDGVEIWIDDARIGRTPFAEEVLLEPGHHSIRAQFAGAAQTKAMDVSAGARVHLVFELSGAEPAPHRAKPSALPSTSIPDQSNRDHTRTWVLIGGATATAVSLGIGTAMRIQSNEARDDAKTLSQQINSASLSGDIANNDGCLRPEQPQACSLLSRSTAAAHRDRDISTVAFLAAGGFGVATLATLILWPSRPSPASRATNSVAHDLHLGTWFLRGGCGLSAAATF